MAASQLCLLAAGIFFLTGLLTGLWKYLCIAATRRGQAAAPVYVDIAHRASLMYAFSALLLREFVPYSPLTPRATLVAVAVPMLFFAIAIAIASYIAHGVLRDTDNQLRAPYRFGARQLPGFAIHGFMILLAIGEIGGFLVLFWGFLAAHG
jgi:hypothetical protein